MHKRLQLLLASFIFSGILSGCSLNDQNTATSTPSDNLEPTSTVEVQPIGSPVTEHQFTATQDEQTALELLQSQASIETTEYGEAGQFVTSIDGVAADSQHYWAFYLNDQYAEAGASQTILKSGDTIKFVYETINTDQ